MGFINAASKRNGLPGNLLCLDTLALARFLLPRYNSHKLDTLAERLNLGSYNHHRAEADAETLSSLLIILLEKLVDEYKTMDLHSLAKKCPFAFI